MLSGRQIYVVRVEQGHLGGARIISCLKWAVGQLLADIHSTQLNTGSTKNSEGPRLDKRTADHVLKYNIGNGQYYD